MSRKRLFQLLTAFSLILYTFNVENKDNPKFVDDIPRSKEEYTNMTKDVKCDSGKVPMYLLYGHNKTVLGCYKDVKITGHYCPELNNGIVQPRFNASCETFSETICTYQYYASQSYKYYQCFEQDGGVETLREKVGKLQKETNRLRELKKEDDIKFQKEINRLKELKKEDDYKCQKEINRLGELNTILLTLLVMSLMILVIVLLSYCIFKGKKDDVTYFQHFKEMCCFLYRKDRESRDSGEETGEIDENRTLEERLNMLHDFRNGEEENTDNVELDGGGPPIPQISFGRTRKH